MTQKKNPAIFQWYDILDENYAPTVAFDKNLNCACLGRYRDPITQNKRYTLVPAENIFEDVHIVERNLEMKISHQTNESRKVSESLSGNESGWSTVVF